MNTERYRRDVPDEYLRTNASWFAFRSNPSPEKTKLWDEKWAQLLDAKQPFPCYDCGEALVPYREDSKGHIADEYCDECWRLILEREKHEQQLQRLKDLKCEEDYQLYSQWTAQQHLDALNEIFTKYPPTTERNLEVYYYPPGMSRDIAIELERAIIGHWFKTRLPGMFEDEYLCYSIYVEGFMDYRNRLIYVLIIRNVHLKSVYDSKTHLPVRIGDYTEVYLIEHPAAETLAERKKYAYLAEDLEDAMHLDNLGKSYRADNLGLHDDEVEYLIKEGFEVAPTSDSTFSVWW
jgi:hypothetical protein